MDLSCLGMKRFRFVLSVAVLLSHALWGQAQKLPTEPSPSLRDPTVAPLQPGAAGPGIPSVGGAGVGNAGLSIIVVDGRPHVIIGTRLYAQGQKLGEARIERISETEVWLREGGQLRKISQFAGIERRSASSAAAPACAASAPRGSKAASSAKTPTRLNPCAGDQP